MKELQTQIRDACPKCQQHFGRFFLPYGDESIEAARDYKPNQIVNNRISGIRKERSLKQLHTYWACCQTTADNTENPQWSTKEKVDFQCRVDAHFVDPNIVVVKPDKTVVFHYLSIAFVNLGHIDACNYFDRAFETMAKFLGTDPETLVEMAQAQMKSY